MNYNGFAFGSEAEWVASELLATFYIVRIYKFTKISQGLEFRKRKVIFCIAKLYLSTISYIACGGYICLMASFIATVGDGALQKLLKMPAFKKNGIAI